MAKALISDTCESVGLHPEGVGRAVARLEVFGDGQDLAELFAAFGDPTRLRILTALSEGDLCVCDLSAALGMTASAVSHQLRLLRSLRLVRSRREGRVVYYRLDDEHVLNLLAQGEAHVRHHSRGQS
ncbi:ArsR/SmtB family transcription factor [Gloeobacter kilaueensis]|uniref:ArsR family transcriptional regulator n=1 Tax=Gloeobacter kilaueensis (strain ATCC BAA-2537 / CCAP 1431/1 / ULC 316 / JS1) TaxID=1183438 RepID=U5QHE3_GLOK1|nr:metalloregulator ArsR/SmtB family transcription factor [Gloeobacter kilaueensis]AGY58298.1 ArsR family transcriptional regulator [Gloeobacter kilaueensis JS1]